MRAAPKGMRLHIGIFGRRNCGKSSLINRLAHRDVSIISDKPGTTTDPVDKIMEMLPIGPVVLIDTAGIDDIGELGSLRIEATNKVINRIDVGLIMFCGEDWGEPEELLLRELKARKASVIAVANKCDIEPPATSLVVDLGQRGIPLVLTSVKNNTGMNALRRALVESVPADYLENPTILSDVVPKGETVVLVMPIDKETPRGRLILPEVQTIRDLLDTGAVTLTVRETEYVQALERLVRPPYLVVTDSQAFEFVASKTPSDVMLTSFSIVYARMKGDLDALAEGAEAIDHLHAGDRVLISEHCTHHPIEQDIGRVKLPNWITERVGQPLNFDHVRGHDFPTDLSKYQLVVHCGACTANRREILSRILACKSARVPITNYGMAIAYCHGILDRAMKVFRQERKQCQSA
ncbi:MAG TPA: [FeFe] hydrogenase H-cluster maturation GTPase HydF [candidate division Zixibacteria bacterium]|nr:[FeFe] hydrogenase H-cluster maturation GTPase HydF [candidate division Zixibacteria bacterium]